MNNWSSIVNALNGLELGVGSGKLEVFNVY
ncbi:MAG: hypothetical protein RIT03_1199 [Bacteroidota bacterium]|jgi:hypothetical protein